MTYNCLRPNPPAPLPGLHPTYDIYAALYRYKDHEAEERDNKVKRESKEVKEKQKAEAKKRREEAKVEKILQAERGTENKDWRQRKTCAK